MPKKAGIIVSTEDVKICRCDYCGRILGKDDDYINMYAGENHWIHFARMKNGINVKEVANYELDFCDAHHAIAYLMREVMGDE